MTPSGCHAEQLSVSLAPSPILTGFERTVAHCLRRLNVLVNRSNDSDENPLIRFPVRSTGLETLPIGSVGIVTGAGLTILAALLEV